MYNVKYEIHCVPLPFGSRNKQQQTYLSVSTPYPHRLPNPGCGRAPAARGRFRPGPRGSVARSRIVCRVWHGVGVGLSPSLEFIAFVKPSMDSFRARAPDSMSFFWGTGSPPSTDVREPVVARGKSLLQVPSLYFPPPYISFFFFRSGHALIVVRAGCQHKVRHVATGIRQNNHVSQQR